jgi:uncharacterized protein (UPF0335 family)
MALRGRPKKEVSYDTTDMKIFVERFFTLEQEKKGIQDAKKDLRAEYKEKVDMKLVSTVIKMVKAELELTASAETVEEVTNLIKDKINMILN